MGYGLFALYYYSPLYYIIIICDIYIVAYSARYNCSKTLYLIQTCSNPAHVSTPKGVYNACCNYRCKPLLKHITITSCQVLIFMDE